MTALRRFLSVAAATVLLTVTGAPAFAGTAETNYLARFVGTWTGSGKMTGAEVGNIACKLVFKMNGAKLNYSGRCNFKDAGAQSFNGSMTYDDGKKQYVSRSNGKTAVASKSGNTLTFTNSVRTMQGSGQTTMTMSPSTLSMNTSLKDKAGNSSRVKLTFKKA